MSSAGPSTLELNIQLATRPWQPWKKNPTQHCSTQSQRTCQQGCSNPVLFVLQSMGSMLVCVQRLSHSRKVAMMQRTNGARTSYTCFFTHWFQQRHGVPVSLGPYFWVDKCRISARS